MKRSFSLSILLILLFSFSYAQVHEIPLSRKSNVKKSITKSNSGIRFSFSQDKIFSKTKTAKDGTSFTDIWLQGSYPNGEVGSPKIPAYKKLIRIPKGSTPSVKVVSHTEEVILLKDKGVNLPIYPNQPSVSKNQDNSILKFEINKATYAQKTYSNTPIASIEVLGNLRSATIARLVVNPIDYNPGEGLVKVYNDIDLDVSFDNSISPEEEQAFDAKTYSPYFDVIYKTLDPSSKSSYTDHPDLTKYPVKMLIVSNRIFEQKLQPFIQWKKLKGFNVKTVYTDEIGSTASQIKTFIQQEYNSASPENPAPTFLVIVGDISQVPQSANGTATGSVTDLYYASVDGDMFPEMYYGRLSATTSAELENIITKIIYYEKYQFADPSYLNHVTLIAGSDGTWNPNVGQPTIKYGTANYFNSSHGFSIVNEFGVTSDPNNSNASPLYTGCYNSDKISVGLINYTAHGSTTSWEGPSLENASISTFTNSNKYPLVIGNCCLSGDFGTSVCFGEAWIRAQNKGAVTYIGSAPNTFWLEDFYWSVGAFPLNGSNDGYVPTFEETTTGLYDAPFVSKYVTTGGMVFAGNLAVTEVNIQGFPKTESSSLYYWEAYNILGDPSLIPYLSEPQPNQASYSSTIAIGESSFTVNALADSYIAISKENQIIGTAFASNTGAMSIPITPIQSTGDVSIVITRPQTIPIIDTITAINPTGPYLLLNSFTIDDQSFNNNGKADYDETFGVNLKIKNIGITDATNVKVKITGTDNYINIVSTDSISALNISHLDGVNYINLDSCFTFTTLENVPDQHVAHFNLIFYSDQGSWSTSLLILLNSPILTLGNITFDDNGSGGNNDSLLNSGETCKALVPVINKGHALAHDITFQISIPDSLLGIASVSNIQTEPFSLEGDSIFILKFGISVTPDLHQEPIIPVTLQASVLEPSSLSQTFEKNIQIIAESVNMSNDPLSTCFTYFYDSGGKDGNYNNSENYTMTFVAQDEINFLKVSFKEFSTESGYDFLYVFDGPNTSSQQIAGSPFSGTILPQEIISSGQYLTFKFTSDDNTNKKGWKATVECIEPQIPNCVTVISPTDGESFVQTSTLTWSSQVFASFYDVFMGSSPNNLSLAGRVFRPQYSFNPKKSSTYFWRVVPGNVVGSNNSGCNIWQFTTDTISRIEMSNNSLEVDTILFYDSGGPLQNYKNDESYTLTLKPKNTGDKISVSFLTFDIESQSTCSYDNLVVYNGLTINSPSLGTFCGVNSPGTILADNTAGALTFLFKSDNNTTRSGWKAVVRTIGTTDAPVIRSNHIKFYPNPVTDLLTINSEIPITSLSVFNTLGLCVLSKEGSMLNQATISLGNLTPGVYILIINSENSIPEKTLIIKK